MKNLKFSLVITLIFAGLNGFADSTTQSVPNSTAIAQASDNSVLTPLEPEIKAQIPPQGLVPSVILQLGKGNVFSQYAFVADKSRRTLTVWQMVGDNLQFVEAHPMDYGKREGDKKVSGDHKTPEGIYFFQKQLEGPSLNFDEYGSKAFTMDYPNHFDSLEKKTGYGIWMHGIPDNKSLKRGSRGCVVVRNEIIQKLGQYINLPQTPIIVADTVNYVSPSQLITQRRAVQAWVQDWISSWESKDLDKYMSFYSEDFREKRFNKKKWKRYKKGLNKKYAFISVKARDPIILNYGEELVIRFIQDYRSDMHIDIGEKNLYVSWNKESNSMQIKGEKWTALENEIVALLQKDDSEPSKMAQ